MRRDGGFTNILEASNDASTDAACGSPQSSVVRRGVERSSLKRATQHRRPLDLTRHRTTSLRLLKDAHRLSRHLGDSKAIAIANIDLRRYRRR